MNCDNCGKELKEGSIFCSNCGERVTEKKEFKSSPKKDTTSKSTQYSDEFQDMLRLEQAKQFANKEIIKGLLICGGGILLTLIGYSSAGYGESYFIWWGLVLWGGYIFVKGLYWRVFPNKLLGIPGKVPKRE